MFICLKKGESISSLLKSNNLLPISGTVELQPLCGGSVAHWLGRLP